MPNPFYPRAPREWWPILNTSADCAGATPVWPLTADAPNVVLDLYSRFVVAWRVAGRTCPVGKSGA